MPKPVVFLTDEGHLFIVKGNPNKLEIERRYELDSRETRAAPVILGRDLIVKDATSVIRFTGR